jgi:dTDP-4-dehydrorhamnose reductase
LLPIESADFPTPARRPNYSVLNKTKIKETFGLQIPHWRTGVRRVLNQLEPV